MTTDELAALINGLRGGTGQLKHKAAAALEELRQRAEKAEAERDALRLLLHDIQLAGRINGDCAVRIIAALAREGK